MRPAPELAPQAPSVGGSRGSRPPPSPSDAGAVRPPRMSRRTPTARRAPKLASVGLLAAGALVVFGMLFPTQRYITPNRGLGYALGIAGGSMMLLLFLYSARKRVRWLAFLGSTARWFRFHMTLGILGPLCILYHANFSLGAANSNIALFSMLTVAGSGLVGRYIYSRIHRGLYGQRLSLDELRAQAEELRSGSGSVRFLPDLLGRLEASEQRLLAAGPRVLLVAVLKPPVVAAMAIWVRWTLHRYIRQELRRAAKLSASVASERRRLARAAYGYCDRRIAATRRLAAFQSYERLFSLWHALHLPLIAILIVAGLAHVIAVNLY